MSTQHWIERLSEYHDGELSPADHAACTSHLAECEQCAEVLREIQFVASAAKSDGDAWPATDLWPGILSQLGAAGTTAAAFNDTQNQSVLGDSVEEGLRKGRVSTGSFGRRRVTFTLPQLALAASLLIAVSAGVVYVAAGRALNQPVAQEDPIQAQAEPIMVQDADAKPANFADAQFDQAVLDLERILIEQRDELDPRTVLIIERNLAVIDEAIQQARTALDADPGNTFLNSHLADSRRRKLDLLRRATTIASTTGD